MIGLPFVSYFLLRICSDLHAADWIGKGLSRTWSRMMLFMGILIPGSSGNGGGFRMRVEMVIHDASSAPGLFASDGN